MALKLNQIPPIKPNNGNVTTLFTCPTIQPPFARLAADLGFYLKTNRKRKGGNPREGGGTKINNNYAPMHVLLS